MIADESEKYKYMSLPKACEIAKMFLPKIDLKDVKRAAKSGALTTKKSNYRVRPDDVISYFDSLNQKD